MSNCVSRTLLVLFAALTVVSCGGGDESPTTPQESNATQHTLAVQTLDTSGRPVGGVGVSLNGGFNGVTRDTDADGKASFIFTTTGVLAGEGSLTTYSPGHHGAYRRFQIDDVRGQLLQLTLLRLEQATLRVTGVTAAATADASALSVEALIAVTDESGRSIDTLALADFGVPDCDVLYVNCIEDSSGPIASWEPAPSPNPIAATVNASAPTAAYRVRFALVAAPGTFVSGRTVNTGLTVRLGVDTVASVLLEIHL